jgi:hypothetical protein
MIKEVKNKMVRKVFVKKDWWKSKTIWAALASLIIACLSAALGETSILTQIAIAISSVLGIYGRINATAEIKK